MNESYVRGFVEKCAELGVDPEQLVKQAFTLPELAIVTALGGGIGSGVGAIGGGLSNDSTAGRGALTGLASGAGGATGGLIGLIATLASKGRIPQFATGAGAGLGSAAAYMAAHKRKDSNDIVSKLRRLLGQ